MKKNILLAASLLFFSLIFSPFHKTFAETDIQEQVLSHIGNSLTEVKNGEKDKVKTDLLAIKELIKNEKKTSRLTKLVDQAIKDIDQNELATVKDDIRGIAFETEKWIENTNDKKDLSQINLTKLLFHLNNVKTLSNESNWEKAQTEYKLFEIEWSKVENDIRKANSGFYGSIEANMITSRSTLFTEKPSITKVNESFTKLIDVLNNPSSDTTKEVSIEKAIKLLNQTINYVESNDTEKAQTTFNEFIQDWPYVEVMVQANSMELYKKIENDTSIALTQLTEKPKSATTMKTLKQIQNNLNLATKKTSYTTFDAGTIVFREGLEALIIISALLALVSKGKQESARKWIFVGGAFGIVASLVAGLLFQFLLSKISAGISNQLIEGISGLIAVVFMLTVGLWLHKQSRQQEYGSKMKEKAKAAIAGGGILSLSLLSFFAVFREGAETVVFYIGMSSSITAKELIAGFSGGIILLVIIGIFILKGSKFIPLKPFFTIASLCIYYLTFKFIGQSIHALQGIGYLPDHMSTIFPTIPKLGIYPSLESIIPQLILLLFVIWLFVGTRIKNNNKSIAA
ncbi:FTR1 family iron permease [Gottfriedia acidiceleris]|uniref:FTR1 family iron permease n=1 Tax=Gottfriedia acidiceleris TaxID=371036 RepID=A0ABY4JHU5_9BACI|nr:FTR1 family protein [Gottfriedia acidiceleris]UPM52659.1 FTR1 family iron permease [Gottfriedia acidiceleris]